MKRSRSVRLALMATTAVAVTACDDPQNEAEIPVTFYRSVEECVAEGKFTETYCTQALEEAQKEHEASAPRYSNQELCEEQFGADMCQPRQQAGGGSFWTPFLVGYVVSDVVDRMTGRRGLHSGPIYYGGGRAGRGYYTPTGDRLRTSPQGVTLPRRSVEAAPPPARVQNRTTVISRGGFGGGRGYSFGG
jgi:uncharacterized protein YgiB involved in biofilm formation